METWDMDVLEKSISKKKKDIDKKMLQNKSMERPVRRRDRDPDEKAILDRLCLNKWAAAEKNGKIKYISKNEWYYEC
jgi:hypothetical protein